VVAALTQGRGAGVDARGVAAPARARSRGTATSAPRGPAAAGDASTDDTFV